MSSEHQKRTCYLSALGDCRGKLTREHTIPQSYLKLFNNYRIIGGPPLWDADGNPLRLWSLTLCKRHNNLLGERVDKTIKNLLLALECYDLDAANIRETKKKKQRLVVNLNQAVSLDRGLICASVLKLAEGFSAARDIDRPPSSLAVARIISGRAVIDRDFRLYLIDSPDWSGDHVSILPWQLGERIEGFELRFRNGIGFLVWSKDIGPSIDQMRANQANRVSFVHSGSIVLAGGGTDGATLRLMCL